ncbi:hypothetical protein GGR57DRAFT_91604 [Xylariaceae sp. FL1272]|nr:hypothetical protein GGR57DRAFT_91604 [Xylariaceae sp. FL1272]
MQRYITRAVRYISRLSVKLTTVFCASVSSCCEPFWCYLQIDFSDQTTFVTRTEMSMFLSCPSSLIRSGYSPMSRGHCAACHLVKTVWQPPAPVNDD